MVVASGENEPGEQPSMAETQARKSAAGHPGSDYQCPKRLGHVTQNL